MNKGHENFKFLFEAEKDNSFSSIDVKSCTEKDKFTTQQLFSEKINPVVFTLILLVL